MPCRRFGVVFLRRIAIRHRTTGTVLGLFVLYGATLAAQTYNLSAFSVPFVQKSQTGAWGINGRGAIVGSFTFVKQNPGDYVTRGFKRDANGVFEPPITDPNDLGYATSARAINDSGVIVGEYNSSSTNSDGPFHGFLLSNGVFTDIYVTPGAGTFVSGINNKGDFTGYVTGYLGSGDLNSRGFVSSGGQVTVFDVPGTSHQTIANGIAADGTIVGGVWLQHRKYHVGFIRGPLGNFKLFQIPGSEYTYPLAINNAVHKIVGYYAVPSAGGGCCIQHGFVYDYLTGDSITVDWPQPAGIYTYITGINSHGEIVGVADGGNLVPVSFIGTLGP